MHLIIGNKNYSSWSFRPWLAMKVAGIAFEETLISLEAHDFKARVKALGAAGKVRKNFPAPPCGRNRRARGLGPARSLRKCMLGSCRCGDICR
jgi:hypothetical protein